MDNITKENMAENELTVKSTCVHFDALQWYGATGLNLCGPLQ